MRHLFTNSCRALAVVGVLATSLAFAQEPAAPPAQPATQSQPATKAQPTTQTPPTTPDQSAQTQPKPVALPTCLEKLNLTPEQQTQIQEIVSDYDADVASVWTQFSNCYLETIRTEAILLSAIEDNLTEPQRQQVRAERRRVAQREKSLAGTNVEAKQETVKPVSAVEEAIEIEGVPLTPEQETAAEATQEKYLDCLRSLNRNIQGLHNRLVSLEADKFVEIEKVLTKEQMQQLCKIRQTAPPTTLGEATNVKDATQTR